MQRRFVQADGVRICLADAGEGEPVVLLPGWPQSIHAWRKVMPRLAERYRVIAIDPPGLGDSEPLHVAPDTRAVAACIRRVLLDLGHERLAVVGHDIGTWIGFALAAAHPEMVSRFAGIDAAVPGLAPPAALAFTPDRVPKVWHFFFNALPELPEALVEGRERLYLEWLFRSRSAAFNSTFNAADIDEYVRCYGRSGAMRGGFDYYRAIFASGAQNQAYAATKLAMPVLAVGGERWLGTAMKASFEPVCDDLTAAVIEGCAHFVPEEAPDRLSDLLLPFLAGAQPAQE